MTKAEMIEELETYLNHIRFAQDCFVAYKTFLDVLGPYNDQINLSPGFFTITQHSLAKCLLLELAKLFCGSGDEKTMRKLVNQVNANGGIFPKKIEVAYQWEDDPNKKPDVRVIRIKIREDIEEANSKLSELAPIIEKLKGRRDKYLAHNDPEFFDGKVNPSWAFPIVMEDVRKLIDFAGMFCNKMLSYLNGNMIAYQSTNADDLVHILRRVAL